MLRFPWHRLDPDERIGAPILLFELGPWTCVKVGRAVRHALRRGEPFDALPEPTTPFEARAREQTGRAVLLYRALLDHRSQPEALRVTQRVVVEGAKVSLAEQLGSSEQRLAALRSQSDGFMGARVRWDRADDDGFAFTVTSCLFPQLCAVAGVPELAPIFCAADAAFFSAIAPGATLERPVTIAGGGAECAFRVRYSGS